MSDKETKELSPLELENGLVRAKDHVEMLRVCQGMLDSGMVPARFKKPAEVFGAVMYVRSLGLPDTAIRQVANVEGTPTIFGDLPLALVRSKGELEYIKEIVFDRNYKEISFANKNLSEETYGALCTVKRKGHEEKSFPFTIDDALKAGLIKTDKPSSAWIKYPKDMLTYRARARALKSEFGDAISGVAIAEYDFAKHPNEIKDVTPRMNINDIVIGGPREHGPSDTEEQT